MGTTAQLNAGAAGRGGSRKSDTNVGRKERIVSGTLGAGMILLGLKRGGLSGALAAMAGVGLAHRGAAGYCPLYKKLNVSTVPAGEQQGAEPRDYFERGIRVEQSVTIQQSAGELYEFWQNLSNLPRFMDHVKSVEVTGDRSHWVVKGPAGKDVEWDAETINQEPGRLIAWRSLPGSEVDNAGTVRFRELSNNRGTEVHVTLEYLPPAGVIGVAVATAFGQNPRRQVREDLRRLKAILETGERPTINGASTGRGKRRSDAPERAPKNRNQRPARKSSQRRSKPTPPPRFSGSVANLNRMIANTDHPQPAPQRFDQSSNPTSERRAGPGRADSTAQPAGASPTESPSHRGDSRTGGTP